MLVLESKRKSEWAVYKVQVILEIRRTREFTREWLKSCMTYGSTYTGKELLTYSKFFSCF